MTLTLHALLAGKPRTMGRDDAGQPFDRTWTSAIFKARVDGPVMLRALGLDGDGQADLEHHGGPDRAVLCYARSHYAAWNARFPSLGMEEGAFGENFSVDGGSEADVCLGDVFRVGGAVVEISHPRLPCWKLARKWRVKELSAIAQKECRVGWYLRVKTEGLVERGNAIELLERPFPSWTVQRAHDVVHHRKKDAEATRGLLSVVTLPGPWKEFLAERLQGAAEGPEDARLVGPNSDVTTP